MNDPNYVPSRWSTDQRVATKCRICGGQLAHPLEAKQEMHDKCKKNYKRKTYGVR
jgi:hypothetical protein